MKNFALTFALLMAASVPLLANQRQAGFCTTGNTLANTQGMSSANAFQASFPSCTVTVYLTGTLTPATLYSDNLSTPTPLSNPFTANADGSWSFYSSNGRYDIVLSGGQKGGFAAPFTVSDILLYDLANGATTPIFNISQRYCGTPFAGDIGVQCNAAAAILTAAGGGKLLLAGQTLTYSTSISLPSYVSLEGQDDGTYLNFTGTGNAITIGGTSGNHITNVKIRNVRIHNGGGQVTPVNGQNCIRADYADNLLIENVTADGCSGFYNIFAKNTTLLTVQNSTVANCSYACIFVSLGSSNIKINYNTVGPVLGSSGGNSYGIVLAGTGESNSDPGNYTVWGEAIGNRVFGVPSWEALDAHGGLHLTFADNMVSDSMIGINVALADDPVSTAGIPTPVIQDLTVKNNKFTQGTGNIGGRCIVAEGSDFDLTNPLVDFWIQGNTCTGFGNTTIPNWGSITVSTATNGHIEKNHVRDFTQNAFYFLNLRNSFIQQNFIYNMIGVSSGSVIGAAFSFNIGNWGNNLDSNTLISDTTAQAPFYFVRWGTQANHVSVRSPNNIVTAPQTGLYSLGAANFPANFSTIQSIYSSKLNYRDGDVVWDDQGRDYYWLRNSNVTAPGSSGFWSIDNSTVLTQANCVAGSNQITTPTGGTGASWKYYLVPHTHVTLATCGSGGVPISAEVTGYLSTNRVTTGFTLSTNMLANSTSNVTFQSGTRVISPQLLNDVATILRVNPALGYQIIPDLNLWASGGTIGFRYSQNGPYLAYNAYQTNLWGMVNGTATTPSDDWTQIDPSQPSYLISLATTGVQMFTTAAGTAHGTFAVFWGSAIQTCTSSSCTLATLKVGTSGSQITGFNLLFTASITPTSVSANTCSDQSFTLTNATASSLFGGVSFPSGPGNLNVQAINNGVNSVTLHFCNPSASPVTPPAGIYRVPTFN